jgi:hypothetical protein
VLHVTLSLVYFQVLFARIPNFITFSAFLLIKTKNQHVDHLQQADIHNCWMYNT